MTSIDGLTRPKVAQPVVPTLTFLVLQARHPLRDFVCFRSLGLVGWKMKSDGLVDAMLGPGGSDCGEVAVVLVHCFRDLTNRGIV